MSLKPDSLPAMTLLELAPVCVVPGSEHEKVPLEVDNAIMFSAKELE
jgi:hypothetical protein